jgi:small-conductance mechanosensitive channel
VVAVATVATITTATVMVVAMRTTTAQVVTTVAVSCTWLMPFRPVLVRHSLSQASRQAHPKRIQLRQPVRQRRSMSVSSYLFIVIVCFIVTVSTNVHPDSPIG